MLGRPGRPQPGFGCHGMAPWRAKARRTQRTQPTQSRANLSSSALFRFLWISVWKCGNPFVCVCVLGIALLHLLMFCRVFVTFSHMFHAMVIFLWSLDVCCCCCFFVLIAQPVMCSVSVASGSEPIDHLASSVVNIFPPGPQNTWFLPGCNVRGAFKIWKLFEITDTTLSWTNRHNFAIGARLGSYWGLGCARLRRSCASPLRIKDFDSAAGAD